MEHRHGEDPLARIERTLDVIGRILQDMQEEVRSLDRRVERLERNQDTHRKYQRTAAIVVNAH